MNHQQQHLSTTSTLANQFAGKNGEYYQKQFQRISGSHRFVITFNPLASLFGPVWFAARGLWQWFLIFILVETFGCIKISLGLFSDLGAEHKLRAENIMVTLEQRRQQLSEAVASGADNVAALDRVVTSLEQAISVALKDAEMLEASRLNYLLIGIGVVLVAKIIQGVLANWALEHSFTLWRSDKSLPSGLSFTRGTIAFVLMQSIYGLSSAQFSYPTSWNFLQSFPTHTSIRVTISDTLRSWFDHIAVSGASFFDTITFGIRTLLDGLETVFVGTPWIVVLIFITMLAWKVSGPRVAILAVAGLSYLGLLGFWDKAMATVALLGAAACVSISIGIPLGILCARKPRVYVFIRPVLDFMQTMPSFVYLIPVIAFFGTGKPAAIIATLIFGSPPVIRLTVLGLQGVPSHVREAASAFGATPSYLLFRVDLPLAAKTIMTGVNQTIMMSLAMVVVASLIGAKGLGEDVLEALQYASTGEGILAGFAILFCSLILDRVIQGAHK